MKFSTKIMIALTLTLILSFSITSVWAAPSRQGTVPPPEDEASIEPNTPIALGTVELTCSVSGRAFREKDPENDIGPAPDNHVFLADVVTVILDAEGTVKLCYPYPEDTERRDGQVHKWDPTTESWVLLESTISGNPRLICANDEEVINTTYALIGE